MAPSRREGARHAEGEPVDRYERVLTESFLSDLKAHRKNRGLLDRVERKMQEIAENPEHFKPLRKPLAGARRVHFGVYVLTFEVRGGEVVFLAFRHHDEVYR